MIKIELEFPTGAEARKALTELLGGTFPSPLAIGDQPKGNTEFAIEGQKNAENFEAPKMEVVKDEIPAGESTKTKRRTKAEIEAEKNAVPPGSAETQPEGGDDIQGDEVVKNEAVVITKEMLQEKAVGLIRNGKKDQVTTTIKSFGADSISQADKNPVKLENYAALMDAFNKL